MVTAPSAALLDQPTLVSNPTASRRLYHWGLAALIGTCLWFINENRWEIDMQTFLGLGIMVLASRPALLWANRNYTWFPAFEIGMLTCIPFYAIPLLAHHRDLRFYPESVITKASWLVVIYIAVASICFSLSRRPLSSGRLLTTSLIPSKFYKLVPLGILFSNIILCIITFTQIVPFEIYRITESLSLGIGTLSIFISAQLWGFGLLNNGKKAFFAVNISIQIVLLFLELYLIRGISLVALAVIAYSMSRRAVPWAIILAFLPIISILHLGKHDMRGQYWQNGVSTRKIDIDEVPAFYFQWIGSGLQAERIEKDTRIRQNTIFERASLIHMLCLSVDRVPREKPYLNGETYIDIPAMFIPRLLWKDKPSALYSTQRLGMYFNIVDSENLAKFSIAFGMLCEAYINFGYIGVIALGALLGFGLNRLARLSQKAPQFSAIGILSILLTAWSLQVEQTAATWVSSLFNTIMVCIGLPVGLRRILSR